MTIIDAITIALECQYDHPAARIGHMYATIKADEHGQSADRYSRIARAIQARNKDTQSDASIGSVVFLASKNRRGIRVGLIDVVAAAARLKANVEQEESDRYRDMAEMFGLIGSVQKSERWVV